ncbi:Swi5-dependent recombination DNA repair protein 1-like [Holothuria leucospilota]|uniref:Swi5-dependent recombination DNA repair protein 1 homolog n=1 Tax=Holothuria leucospilota TaxID=206669 RepID=A0A9Q0YPI7_HOLLE|nr:Swi5-dependent recombination DNA repair protein 1-like [Holothuria leucospilota]
MNEDTAVEALQDERRQLKELLEEKEAILRKLNLAKSYKEKNDLAELDVLTEKWRSACQEAIRQLYDILPEPKPTITEMIDSWKISHKMIRYDKEEESFY